MTPEEMAVAFAHLTPPENMICERCKDKIDFTTGRWRKGPFGWEHQCLTSHTFGAIGGGVEMGTPACRICNGPMDKNGICVECEKKAGL